MSSAGPDLAADTRACLAAIVDDAYDAIVSKTLDGTILSWNRGAERLFGYAAHEVLGRSISVLVPLDRLDEEAQVTARIGAGDVIPPFDTTRRRKDGLLAAIALAASPLKDERGRIIGTSLIAREVGDGTRPQYEVTAPLSRLQHTNPATAWRLAALEDELRNRLHVVTIAAQLLARSPRGDASADQAREILARQANELPRLVNLFAESAAHPDESHAERQGDSQAAAADLAPPA